MPGGPETIRTPLTVLSPADFEPYKFSNLYQRFSDRPYSQALLVLGVDPAVPVHEQFQGEPNEELTRYQESINSIRVGRFYVRTFPVLAERLGYNVWKTGIAKVMDRLIRREANPAEARSFINGVLGILETLPDDKEDPRIFDHEMRKFLGGEFIGEDSEVTSIFSPAQGAALLALALPNTFLDDEQRKRLFGVATEDEVIAAMVETQSAFHSETQPGLFEGSDYAQLDERTLPFAAKGAEMYLKSDKETNEKEIYTRDDIRRELWLARREQEATEALLYTEEEL